MARSPSSRLLLGRRSLTGEVDATQSAGRRERLRFAVLARPLSTAFFARDAETVARALIGSTLVRSTGDMMRRARIVETEAYVGVHDLACHAAKGRTRRTEVMFGPAGRAYVYLIYGMHQMLNLVTGPDGDAQAVLLRAAEPLGDWTANLGGPGRLARGFGITPADNGLDVTTGPLRFEPSAIVVDIGSAVRVGIDYAGEWAQAPLRFFDTQSRAVSKPWPAGHRPPTFVR